MSRRRLGELLIDLGLVDKDQVRAALAKQREWGKRLGEVLVKMNMITDRQLAGVLSQQLNMPAVNLTDQVVDPRLAQQLGEEFCRHNECLPFAYHDKGRFLDMAMSNPLNLEIFEEVRVKMRCNPRPYVVGPVALKNALSTVFGSNTSDFKIPTAEFDDVGIAGEALFELGSRDSFQALGSNDGLPSVDIDLDEGSVSVAKPLGVLATEATQNALHELRGDIRELRQSLGQTNHRLDYLIKLLETVATQGSLPKAD